MAKVLEALIAKGRRVRRPREQKEVSGEKERVRGGKKGKKARERERERVRELFLSLRRYTREDSQTDRSFPS